MGVIERIFSLFFGGGRNVLRETAEVFLENTETSAQRGQDLRLQAMKTFAQEFYAPQRGGFDRFMDGINRLPRPLLAMGCLGLLVSAMVHPVWFAQRMQGIALVPEPLWWLLGVIVSFYFGARHQAKGQEFQNSVAQTLARVPGVVDNIRVLQALSAQAAHVDDPTLTADLDTNPALDEWASTRDTATK